FLSLLPPPRSLLFPYTTLFRSVLERTVPSGNILISCIPNDQPTGNDGRAYAMLANMPCSPADRKLRLNGWSTVSDFRDVTNVILLPKPSGPTFPANL